MRNYLYLILIINLFLLSSCNKVDKIEVTPPDFTSMNFGCDGNSITAGNQWSAVVVNTLGFATHHNVAVGSATFACHNDTQEYGAVDFAGISEGWQPTEDPIELLKRHNNCSKVHIQKFITEVKDGFFPEPDIFVFSLGTNDYKFGEIENALDKNLERVDITTMAGGARWAIQTIKEAYPKCKVFFCTPIQSGDPERNQNNLLKIDILNKICSYLSVNVIDCYNHSGIMAEFEFSAAPGKYLIDGLHPNEDGQELMGNYISQEIYNSYYN